MEIVNSAIGTVEAYFVFDEQIKDCFTPEMMLTGILLQ
jgi:hypothetical protein